MVAIAVGLHLRLLGEFGASVGGRALPAAWSPRKARQLLKLLALAPSYRLHRDQVLEALWPDLTSDGGTKALYQVLFHLRRALEPDLPRGGASRYVHLEGDSVLLDQAHFTTDVDHFTAAASLALRAHDLPVVQEVLALYSGELLPEDRYQEWTLAPRRALQQQYVSLLAEAARLHEQAQDYEAAIAALQRILEVESAHEPAHAGLMRLYAATGRRDLGLRQFEQLTATLRELDASPDLVTQRLHASLRDGGSAVAATGEMTPGANRIPPAPYSARPNSPLPAPASPSRAPSTLPRRLTSFVGREREVEEITQLLATAPLVTLTGAGGVGKTRLALEVASRAQSESAVSEVVHLAELASLAGGTLVSSAVGTALGVQERSGESIAQTIAAEIGDQRTLLVLDNCEHVVDAVAPLVQMLLGVCPTLRILATSREPLGIDGETLYRVPTLDLPPDDLKAEIDLSRHASTRLFLERARAALSGFQPSPGEAIAVARICWRLDGIPLALELAAARVGSVGVAQLADRLDHDLQLLAGGRARAPRHQTLRAAVDWSHDLLTPDERRVFARLSVFRGGFTLEAADAVCGAGQGEDAVPAGSDEAPSSTEDVLGVLLRLVERSLVVAEPQGEGIVRYRLLEPLREYATARLLATGSEDETRTRLAAFVEAWAESIGRQPLEPIAWRAWRERVDLDVENVRVVLRWMLQGGAIERGLRLMMHMFDYWQDPGTVSSAQRYSPGTPGEALNWYEMFLNASTSGVPAELLADTLTGASLLAQWHGDAARSVQWGEASEVVRRRLGHHGVSGPGLSAGPGFHGPRSLSAGLGVAYWIAGQPERAERRLETRLAAVRTTDGQQAANTLIDLSHVARSRGDYARARALIEESIAVLADPTPFQRRRAEGLLARVLYLQGEVREAAHVLRRALPLFTFGRQARRADALAAIATALGEPERAACLFGAAEATRRRTGEVHYGPDVPDYQRDLAATRAALGSESFEAAWRRGERLSLEHALAYAHETAGLIAPDNA